MILFDPAIRKETNDLVNLTPALRYGDELKMEHGLLCSMIDRMLDILEYFQMLKCVPQTREEIVLFLTYAGMMIDVVEKTFLHLGLDWHDPVGEEQRFFGKVAQSFVNGLVCEGDKNPRRVPNDNKFFKYIRSVAVAHPVDTTNQPFILKGEIHFSPWVMTPLDCEYAANVKEHIGVRIYTNRSSNVVPLMIPFESVLEYLDSRYRMLVQVNEFLRKLCTKVREEWKCHRIERVSNMKRQLAIIRDTLQTRSLGVEYVNELLGLISIGKVHDRDNNLKVVARFVEKLCEALPRWCDFVDMLKHEELAREMCAITDPQLFGSMPEQLRDLYCEVRAYLNETTRLKEPIYFHRALKALNQLDEQVCRKWVTLDVETMPLKELEFLVVVAMYFERQWGLTPWKENVEDCERKWL